MELLCQTEGGFILNAASAAWRCKTRKLLVELKRKGLRIAGLLEEPAWIYSGRDDDFNFVAVWVVDDLI